MNQNSKKFKKILLTGAAGFIGFHTINKLIKEGYEVVGLDNINDYYDVNLKFNRLKELGIDSEKAKKWGEVIRSNNYSKFSFVRMNLEDRQQLIQLFENQNFEAVINLAAQAGVRYSIENPYTYIDANIVGFLNILECCRHNHIRHLVYASTSSVYGQNEEIPFSENDRVDTPISLYAASKKANEIMAYTYSHLYGLQTSGLRFFTVYGPWGRPDMALFLFADAIAKKEPIKVFNYGDMSRDFTYVDDIVQGIVLTLNSPPKNKTVEENKMWYSKNPNFQVFNIGNGAPASLMEFIETIEKEMGRKAEKSMLPMQAGDVPKTWADTSQLEKIGYKSTTPISIGIKKFVEWFRSYYNLN